MLLNSKLLNLYLTQHLELYGSELNLYSNKNNKWIIIEAEQDPKKANPLKYARIGYRYLSKTLTDVGYFY